MALKQSTEKIPSPSDIAKSIETPQQPIQNNNSIKFEEVELKKLQNLQTSTNQVVNSFGQLKISEIRLESQLEFLKSKLDSLRKEETDLATVLSKKYGKGTLNAETGEFTPSK